MVFNLAARIFGFWGSLMMKHSQLAAAIAATFVVVSAASAQTTPQKVEKVEVTGSAIKRVNAEGPAPVEVITRQDIERTGATTVNELLRSIPSIDIFDQGELASNSPGGSGTANIRLRGLSSSNVLVLLNGRRLPVNALYDASGAGGAVDINMIPLSAIERVEILKDGGSAIYGADAVAGVVNFITKKDYRGIEARVSYGISSEGDAKEINAGLSGGFGNLASDRYNVFFGLDYFKRDPLLRADREISRSVDFRRFGATDRRSSFAPTGNVVDPNTGGLVGVTYKDCPPANFNAICRYDFNASLLSAYNGADRVSGILLANAQITPDIRAFFEVGALSAKDTFKAHPVPDFFLVPTLNAEQAAYEAEPGKIFIAGRFMQGGPRTTERKSDVLTTAFGLEGAAAGFDFKANVGYGESKITNSDSNYYDADKWNDATGSGALDPTISTNSEALVNSLKVRPVRTGKSTISYVNLQASREIFNLPGGPAQIAVGASANRESLVDTPDPLTQAGKVIGSIKQAAVDAKRNYSAVYAELALPILKDLEAQAAVRYDKYPGVSQTSPKVAFKWNALPNTALRGSYSGSFRAPVLKQLFGAQEQGAITITNPALCAILGVTGNCLVNAFQVNGSNPNLTPEKGKTFNVGVVGDYGPLSATVDWWRIEKTNIIATPTIATAIQSGAFVKDGPRFLIFTNLRNFAEGLNEGVDTDLRFRFPGTAIGTVTVRNLNTYYTKVRTRSLSTDPWSEFNGTYATPRWRNSLTVSSEKGPWSGAVTFRTVAGFIDEDTPSLITSSTRSVEKFDETDISLKYTGFRNIELTGGIKNLFDRQPPFSLQNASDNSYTQMGFAEIYTNRGRFYYAGLNYKFR